MPDHALVLGKLGLLRRAFLVALEHAEILRQGVEDDDVDAMVRGRLGLGNARDMARELIEELDRDVPDWRPQPRLATVPEPDGWSGEPPTYSLEPSPRGIVRPTQPDAHLGAVE